MSRYFKVIFLIALFALGSGVRLYDLTDQPLDFHPTRQLRNAIVARGVYYQLLPDADPALRERAIAYGQSVGQYEPPILENLVARAYLLMGGEYLWVSRLFTIFFWLVAGLAVFDLARRMTSWGGGLAALAYTLILPFGVQASRSFQPDPGMVMWLVLGVYFLYRWWEQRSWKWALLAGVTGGMALLTKIVALYIVGAAAVTVVLAAVGIKRFWRDPQVWTMAVLIVLPAAWYYSGRQGRAAEYLDAWTISLSHLLIEPSFYVRWLSLVQSLMGFSLLLASLVGVLVAERRYRTLLLSLWVGYLVYGLTLPYQMYTHSYYHLMLVPVIGLSLAPVAQLLLDRVAGQGGIWRLLFAGIVLAALVYPAWVSVSNQAKENDRLEPAYWEHIGSLLPSDGKILALTQDYGFRLIYYGWRKVTLWPIQGEQTLAKLRGKGKDFEDEFASRIEGKSYFLITAFGQFNNQPELKQYLAERYPVFAQGDGYLIYDLENPLP
jgi:hypothetical protein